MNQMKSGGRSGDVIPKGYNVGSLQNFTPQQNKLFGQMFGHLGPDSYLSKLASGDQSTYDEMEAPAMRQFSGELGNIASRFSGMGRGARKGSGFQNTVTSAASNFAQDLQSKRSEMRRQALNDLFGFSNAMLNQRPEDRQLFEKPQKPQNSWLNSFGSGVGHAIPGAIQGFLAGGPAGAAVGGASGFASGIFK